MSANSCECGDVESAAEPVVVQPPVKRKRGRPPKRPSEIRKEASERPAASGAGADGGDRKSKPERVASAVTTEPPPPPAAPVVREKPGPEAVQRMARDPFWFLLRTR